MAVADPGSDHDRPGTADTAVDDPDVTILLEGVEITYRVYADRRPQLKDLFLDGFRNRNFREINAIRGISLTAHEGEAIGLVGRNGSGKSTLLAAMAGLLPVDAGTIHATAEPTLLGVGAALNNKVSGRRNIELGLLALGMSSNDVQQHIDGAIEFSGLEEYIDLPLTAYSTGMKARLHFSIATAIQPEILLIDEALAVGDHGFRRKSEERIQQLLANAGTVFVVSHSESAIRNLCNRAIWIDQGLVQLDGPVDDVMDAYGDFAESGDTKPGTTHDNADDAA